MDFVFCASEKEQKKRSFGDALRNIVNITSFTTNARSYLVFFQLSGHRSCVFRTVQLPRGRRHFFICALPVM